VQHLAEFPHFLHFVGLDRGRHPGLPWGVAKVTRPCTKTESLSHGSINPFDGYQHSKATRNVPKCEVMRIQLGY
jgi:hypothetical protein